MEQAGKVWIQTSLQESHTDCLSVGQLLLFATGALFEAVDFICILYIMNATLKAILTPMNIPDARVQK